MLEKIAMSQQELDRYHLLRQVLSKQLTQAQAASLLGISERQVRNLLQAIKLHGAKGIVSKSVANQVTGLLILSSSSCNAFIIASVLQPFSYHRACFMRTVECIYPTIPEYAFT